MTRLDTDRQGYHLKYVYSETVQNPIRLIALWVECSVMECYNKWMKGSILRKDTLDHL
jgi:hypothetical protein